MDYYQHDLADAFRFRLVGSLSGSSVPELEHAWTTATSILRGKRLVIDVTDLSGLDGPGRELLLRMVHTGAHCVLTRPPVAPDLWRELTIPLTREATSQRRSSWRDARSYLFNRLRRALTFASK